MRFQTSADHIVDDGGFASLLHLIKDGADEGRFAGARVARDLDKVSFFGPIDHEIAALGAPKKLIQIGPIGQWEAEAGVVATRRIERVAGDGTRAAKMTSVAGLRFVGAIERSTYHKKEERRTKRSRQGATEDLVDRLPAKMRCASNKYTRIGIPKTASAGDTSGGLPGNLAACSPSPVRTRSVTRKPAPTQSSGRS